MARRSFDDTREYGQLIDPDWYDMSLTEVTLKKSSKGDNMMVLTYTVDSGQFAGTSFKEYIMLEGAGEDMGLQKLKTLGVKSGFAWDSPPEDDKFAKQFADHDPPLRVSGEVKHNYSIKARGTWKNGVSKVEYDDWIEQEGEGSIRGELVAIGFPQNEEPELQMSCAWVNDLDKKKRGKSKDGEKPEAPEPTDLDFEDDDEDVPF